MEKKFQHIWNLAEQISVKRNDRLQSHYLLQCKELEQFGMYHLPSKLFSELMLCKFCFNAWNSENFSIKILPQHKPGKKMMKLLHKRTFKKPLTKCELSLLDKHDKNNCSNKISLLCLLCHKTSKISVRKPISDYSKINEAAVLEDVNIPMKKKKKKKKDPFAGLNRLVCTPKSVKQKLSHYSNTKTTSESEPNSSSKQTLKCLNTTNGTAKSIQKMRSSLAPYNSPLTSKTWKSKGLQKILFQDKNKSKISPLKAFLADL